MKTVVLNEHAPASKRIEQTWFEPTKPPARMTLRKELDEYSAPPMTRGPAFAAVALALVCVAVGGTYYLFRTPSANPAIVAAPPAAPPVGRVGATTLTNGEVITTRPRDEIPAPPPVTAAAPVTTPAPVASPVRVATVVKAPVVTRAPARVTTPKRQPVVNPNAELPDLDRAATAAGITPETATTPALSATEPALSATEPAPSATEPAPTEVLPDLQLKR